MRYFFDLPVYRLPRDRYYAERDKYIDSIVYQTGTSIEAALRERDRKDPNANVGIRDHLQRSYGGCWDFNEIIGYIRLHFLGDQVRGEYFSVSKKRIVRTRTKTLEYQTHKLAPEVSIERPAGTAEVLAAVREYIADCRKELPKSHHRHRYVRQTRPSHRLGCAASSKQPALEQPWRNDGEQQYAAEDKSRRARAGTDRCTS